MLISIIIPALNKEKTIVKDITTIHSVMADTRWDLEIIVVDDGSTDNTRKELKKLKKPNIKTFSYDNNKGKGYALRYGMARANGDIVSFIDSGMDIDPNGISMLLEHMIWYDADIIVGSKKHPVSQTNYPFIRKVYSWGYHTMCKLLFGIHLNDTQTGLKVFKRNVLEKVLPRLMVKEFAFDIEVIAVARHLGFKRIYEAPVKVIWDFNDTNFNKFLFMEPYIRRMIVDTLAIFYRLFVLRYYDDNSSRKWVYDKELEMRVNTGEMK